ncbi:MAG: dUTPase [Puniceicoccales bacterium]|nr:dUTPase [Puniceicoccales bacterium]
MSNAAEEDCRHRSCKLAHLFELQRRFGERIGLHLNELTDEEKKDWVLNYTRAMQQEIAELVDSLPWKWWAKYQEFDLQNARVELVDIFHFVISTALVLGMDENSLYEAFLKKNEVNHARQDSGYARKNPDDSKHI